MDKVEQYRQFIKEILTEHAQIASTNDEVKAELIFDGEHDHYQLAYVGWQGNKRVNTARLRKKEEIVREIKTRTKSNFY